MIRGKNTIKNEEIEHLSSQINLSPFPTPSNDQLTIVIDNIDERITCLCIRKSKYKALLNIVYHSAKEK
jgi:hypothetical protein